MNNRDIKESIACSIAQCNGACLVLKIKKKIKKNPNLNIDCREDFICRDPYTF